MKLHYEQVLPAPGFSFQTEQVSGPVVDCIFHVHPEYELTLVESGRGFRFVGDGLETFAAGDLVLIGPMLPHHYFNAPEDRNPEWYHCHVVKFKRDFWGTSFLRLPELSPVRNMLDQASGGLVFPEEAAAGLKKSLPVLFGTDASARLLELLRVLFFLSGFPCRRINAAFLPSGSADERLERVITFIHKRLEQGASVTLKDAAKIACMTPQAFSRYFSMMTRRGFIRYVTELKLNRAVSLLLNTNDTILEIALASGFHNLSNFNRHFLRLKKQTPFAYREAWRKQTG